MNDISSTLFYDQRICISQPIKNPITWKISKVENMNPKGVNTITFAQDRWDEHKDAFNYEDSDGNSEFISDFYPDRNIVGIYADYFSSYIIPEVPDIEPQNNIRCEILWNAQPQLKVGGGYKKFTLKCYDNDEEIDLIPGSWEFTSNGNDVSDLLLTSFDENVLKVKFIGDDSYIGTIIEIKYNTDSNISASVNVEVIGL